MRAADNKEVDEKWRQNKRVRDIKREREREKKLRVNSILLPVMCMTLAAWVKGVFFLPFGLKAAVH